MHTLAIQFNEALLILRQLGSAGNLINLSLQDGDLTIPPSLQRSIIMSLTFFLIYFKSAICHHSLTMSRRIFCSFSLSAECCWSINRFISYKNTHTGLVLRNVDQYRRCDCKWDWNLLIVAFISRLHLQLFNSLLQTGHFLLYTH